MNAVNTNYLVILGPAAVLSVVFDDIYQEDRGKR